MSVYLLDTDAVIDALKGIPATVELVRGLAQAGHMLATCDVVTGEVWAGLYPQDQPQGEPLLASFLCLATWREAAARPVGGISRSPAVAYSLRSPMRSLRLRLGTTRRSL